MQDPVQDPGQLLALLGGESALADQPAQGVHLLACGYGAHGSDLQFPGGIIAVLLRTWRKASVSLSIVTPRSPSTIRTAGKHTSLRRVRMRPGSTTSTWPPLTRHSTAGNQRLTLVGDKLAAQGKAQRVRPPHHSHSRTTV